MDTLSTLSPVCTHPRGIRLAGRPLYREDVASRARTLPNLYTCTQKGRHCTEKCISSYMKRLNPKTNQPFERGFQREDGKFFLGYQNKISKKTGMFYESWGCGSYLKNYGKQYYRDNRSKALILQAKYRASRNGAECTIDETWLENKLKQGHCELTGLPFDFEPSLNTKNNPYAPSIDRVDSANKNYTPENCRVVLSFVNVALNDLGLEKSIPILKALIEKHDEKNKSKNQSAV